MGHAGGRFLETNAAQRTRQDTEGIGRTRLHRMSFHRSVQHIPSCLPSTNTSRPPAPALHQQEASTGRGERGRRRDHQARDRDLQVLLQAGRARHCATARRKGRSVGKMSCMPQGHGVAVGVYSLLPAPVLDRGQSATWLPISRSNGTLTCRPPQTPRELVTTRL